MYKRQVHYRANAAHSFHITGALHLAQRVTDYGAAYPQLGGKVYLGGQTDVYKRQAPLLPCW